MGKNRIYLWKSLGKDCTSEHNDFKWELNKWYKIEGRIDICINGFHASENLIDAISYIRPKTIAKCEVRGESIKHIDKQCWSEMRIVKSWEWSKEDSVKLAIYAASLVLHIYEKKHPDDKRPRNAIKAAKNYLKKRNTAARAAWAARAARAAEDAWDAAGDAWDAWDARAAGAARAAAGAARAAGDAARAAWDAARAAGDAARAAGDAAWAARAARAAGDAAWAARAAGDAAWAEIKTKCHNYMIKLVERS